MPKSLPAVCRRCGSRRRDGVAVSRRGLCYPCGEIVLAATIEASKQAAGRATSGEPDAPSSNTAA